MQQLDVRAMGCLLGELIERCADGADALGALPALRDACVGGVVSSRELAEALSYP